MKATDALRIRAATIDDLADVIALAEALFGEVDHRSEGDPPAAARKLLKEDPSFVALLALRGSAAVGLATLSQSFAIYVGGSFGLIHELYVRPRERSSGVGRALLQEARHIGERRGWLRLEVTAAPRALAFYRDNGFQGTGPHLKWVLAKPVADI